MPKKFGIGSDLNKKAFKAKIPGFNQAYNTLAQTYGDTVATKETFALWAFYQYVRQYKAFSNQNIDDKSKEIFNRVKNIITDCTLDNLNNISQKLAEYYSAYFKYKEVQCSVQNFKDATLGTVIDGNVRDTSISDKLKIELQDVDVYISSGVLPESWKLPEESIRNDDNTQHASNYLTFDQKIQQEREKIEAQQSGVRENNSNSTITQDQPPSYQDSEATQTLQSKLKEAQQNVKDSTNRYDQSLQHNANPETLNICAQMVKDARDELKDLQSQYLELTGVEYTANIES